MTETLQRTAQSDAEERSPVAIRKLGHVVFRVRDVERSTRFYTEILNFRVSDINEQGMVFFTAFGDHHTVAIMGAAAGEAAEQPPKHQLGLSHFAMEVGSLEELFAIREFLKRKGVPVTFEGRKGAGSNVGVEFLDPDGYQLELYWNMDQLGPSDRARPADQWNRVKTLEDARDQPLPTEWPR
jgi:catechol 2,3-dioxygenase-like lactoylglutathione lyase family enzyme